MRPCAGANTGTCADTTVRVRCPPGRSRNGPSPRRVGRRRSRRPTCAGSADVTTVPSVRTSSTDRAPERRGSPRPPQGARRRERHGHRQASTDQRSAATFSALDSARRLSVRRVVSPDWAMDTAVTPARTPRTMSSWSASSCPANVTCRGTCSPPRGGAGPAGGARPAGGAERRPSILAQRAPACRVCERDHNALNDRCPPKRDRPVAALQARLRTTADAPPMRRGLHAYQAPERHRRRARRPQPPPPAAPPARTRSRCRRQRRQGRVRPADDGAELPRRRLRPHRPHRGQGHGGRRRSPSGVEVFNLAGAGGTVGLARADEREGQRRPVHDDGPRRRRRDLHQRVRSRADRDHARSPS